MHKVPPIRITLRTNELSYSMQVQESVGHTRVCSLAGDSGIDPSANQHIHITRMAKTKVMEEPTRATARLIKHLATVCSSHFGLKIQFKRFLCDFIKDDRGRWWFIQVNPYIRAPTLYACTQIYRIHTRAYTSAHDKS